jgi:hypothetical protein
VLRGDSVKQLLENSQREIVASSWPVPNLPLFGQLTSAFLCADGSATSKISTGGKAFMSLFSGRAGGVSAMIGADWS